MSPDPSAIATWASIVQALIPIVLQIIAAIQQAHGPASRQPESGTIRRAAAVYALTELVAPRSLPIAIAMIDPLVATLNAGQAVQNLPVSARMPPNA